MDKNKNFLYCFLKLICPSKIIFYFEENDYISNTIFMCCVGIKAIQYTLSHGRLSPTFSLIERFCNRNKYNDSFSKSNSNTQELADKKTDSKSGSTVNLSTMNYLTASCFEDPTGNKKKKLRPNYFVAFQVTNDEVHASVKLVQEHILQQDKRFEKSLISRNTLHITLTVLNLKDSDEHINAMKALYAVYQEYNNILCEDPLKLEFSGIGNFGNKVLFAKLKQNSSYDRMCEISKSIHAHLEAVGIYTTDKRAFNPHLTIAKIDFSKKSYRGIKKLPVSLYEKYNDLQFGINAVKSIQLLKMDGPKTSSGYYAGDELSFSKDEPILWKKLNSLLFIAEKKKEIRHKISKLTENMFKKTSKT